MSRISLQESDLDSLGVAISVIAGMCLFFLCFGLARIKALIFVFSAGVFSSLYFFKGHFNGYFFGLALLALILLVSRMIFWRQFWLGRKWYGDDWAN
jgi:phosphoglycerol transferase MdoB-like AlkP superfamily enzyme